MGTEMFHFPTFPPHGLYIHPVVTPHHWCWVSPFGHPRITARLTTPRGLSRPPTSFIGSWYQGIHRTPLTTYNNTYKHTPTAPHTSAPPPRPECRQTTKNSTKHTNQKLIRHALQNKDARIHYALLKQHTPTTEHPSHTPPQGTINKTFRIMGTEETCVPSEPRQCVTNKPASQPTMTPESITDGPLRQARLMFHPRAPRAAHSATTGAPWRPQPPRKCSLERR